MYVSIPPITSPMSCFSLSSLHLRPHHHHRHNHRHRHIHHHHHQVLFHAPLCNCHPSSVRVSAQPPSHASAFYTFDVVHLHRAGRVQAGKMLDEMPPKETSKVKRVRKGRKIIESNGELGNDSTLLSRLGERVEGKISERRDNDLVHQEKGRGATGGKWEDGEGDGEVGISGLEGGKSGYETGDGNVDKSVPSASDAVDSVEILLKSEQEVESKRNKRVRKGKPMSPKFQLKVGLDLCSKRGDVMGALSLYDMALRDEIEIERYHYNVVLHLCSSAALGVVHPGKSGSIGSRSSSVPCSTVSSDEVASSLVSKEDSEVSDGDISSLGSSEGGDAGIRVSKAIQSYASKRGFEIYEKMLSDNVPLNEATLTSLARLAMAKNDGDLAFEAAKKIEDLGLTSRLRSYGPAIFSFCNNDDIHKAFEVEKYMLECGIQLEESELAALLKTSIKAQDSEKVYYLLHKLRTNVGQVSGPTAELIVSWFSSSKALRVGKRKWNTHEILNAMANNGGGWHGLGWLGKGKWNIVRAKVGDDGICQSCGEQLVAMDIDPVETEKFAQSVASIAMQREGNSSFQNFQKWLEDHGPFEAVIDAANVGLFNHRHFSAVEVDAVVKGICEKLSLKRSPLIIVHNKRICGGKMDQPASRNAKKLVEKWKEADAIYATPTGSNDDWYWLYAAVKCQSLIITNDEMRDHNFEILGNDFFPRWKERHQVHFNIDDKKPLFIMPPACSVLIQESQRGHWHIPISGKAESGRTWLCITRSDTQVLDEQSSPFSRGRKPDTDGIVHSSSTSEHHHQVQRSPGDAHNRQAELVRSFVKMLSPAAPAKDRSIGAELAAAEMLSGHVIDFEI